MKRIKPYTTNQQSWRTILGMSLCIPMNQREYSWQAKEITRFLDDIFRIFKEEKYVEKMGSIYNLNYNNVNQIFDGQQRILTTILMLIAIGNLVPKLKNKIIDLLAVDTLIDKLTSEQEKLKEKYNVNIIPTIYCVNPNDMEGLINIFNNNIHSCLEFVSNTRDFIVPDNNEHDHEHEDESEDENEDEDQNEDEHKEKKYICKHCNAKISSKSKFIEHLTNKHDYNNPKPTTKLYDAYIIIYDYLISKDYSVTRMIELYKFILDDIDIQFYNCNDPLYVSIIFELENNRGMQVEDLDIVKNAILVEIPDDKKVEVYEKWEMFKHKKNAIYKKGFGQKLFDIAIQLYNKEIARTIDLDELFKPIIDHKDSYKELNKFFKIVETLFEIMDKISNDKYGRLVNNKPRICLNWEAYMWCLLPIFYTTKTVNVELIKLLTKWYFRNIQFKTRNFNNLGYSNEFLRIANECIKDNKYDYYKEIFLCLDKNKDIKICEENYKIELKNMEFTAINATYLLLFYETCISNDRHIVPLATSLEHIYCQKDITKLLDKSLMNTIGNLTLLEGKNSLNGHKGNSSLGCKPYNKKKMSYESSSYMTSRNIVKDYDTFEEKDIILRSDAIINELNKYTKYF